MTISSIARRRENSFLNTSRVSKDGAKIANPKVIFDPSFSATREAGICPAQRKRLLTSHMTHTNRPQHMVQAVSQCTAGGVTPHLGYSPRRKQTESIPSQCQSIPERIVKLKRREVKVFTCYCPANNNTH